MKEIPYSSEKPAIYDALEKRFGNGLMSSYLWDSGVIIAYDGKIHSKDRPTAEKIVHENVHLMEQERMGNQVWWSCYLDSPDFRLEQEIMAFKAEADFIKKHIKHREHRFRMINEMADNLSGEKYGRLIGKREALSLLL